MVILYMVFLLPLTIDAYHLAGYGHYCSDPSTRIRTRAACQAAAASLGLVWGNGWWGPWDFAGCLHTRDGRNRVYFNYSPWASSTPNNPNYAETCTGPGQPSHYGLVVTGGDNPSRIGVSEQISSMGVCVSPNTNIPNLPQTVSGAKSVWIDDSKHLMFCGGSEIFAGHSTTYPWGARDTCWKLSPGGTAWESDANMKVERSWFSLNSINNKQAVAAGGMTVGGSLLDSMEEYTTGGGWEILKRTRGPHIGTDIKLTGGLYGHCAVQYTTGGYPHLMTIGGSIHNTDFSLSTNEVTAYNLVYGTHVNQLPGALTPVWAPACVKDGDDIYVSGGENRGTASNKVYKGTITGGFIHIGVLSAKISGHTMGLAFAGQLFVAGGYKPDTSTYLKEIQSSVDSGSTALGVTWETLTTELTEGGEYAAMASVPPFTFTCTGP